MADRFDVTKRTLTLGAVDATTGWYSKSFTEDSTDQEMIILRKGEYSNFGGCGFFATYDYTGFSLEPYKPYDELSQSFEGVTRYFRVLNVDPQAVGTDLVYYKYNLAEISLHADQPSTSGTWNTTQNDPRERTKTWLEAYLSDAAILKDDNATQADWICQFAFPEYNIDRIFDDKTIDLIVSVEALDGIALYLHSGANIYAFKENIRIHFNAVDKTGITAVNLLDKAKQEFYKELNLHGKIAGSFRMSETHKDNPVRMSNGQLLYGFYVDLSYKRANENFVATHPNISYGTAWCYDGNRIAGSTEGTLGEWEDGLAGSFSIDPNYGLKIVTTGEATGNKDYHVYTGTGDDPDTSLGINTTLYPNIRYRYKSDGTAKAELAVGYTDSSWDTILSNGTNTSWTVGTGTLDTGKTLKVIDFITNNAAGTVYWDFIQVFKGTYILPNVINLKVKSEADNTRIASPGYYGRKTSKQGTNDIKIEMLCDTDMESTSLSWFKPQTSTATDYNPTDTLLDINLTGYTAYGGAPWEWLDCGTPAQQFKVTLDTLDTDYKGDGSTAQIIFNERRIRSAKYESINERTGRSLS